MPNPCPDFVHHWWQWHPPVGSFIAVLAVIGVLVPWFRGDASRREKAMWTIAMFVLLGLELRTLYRDRTEHDEEQTTARCQQLQSFQRIATSLDTAIAQSADQFRQTAQGLDATIKETKETIENTAPHADVRLDQFSSTAGPQSPVSLVFNQPMITNVFYHNAGTDVATRLTVWVHYYIGKPDDLAAQLAIKKQFEKDWKENVKPSSFSSSLSPSTVPVFGSFAQTLTADDLRALKAGQTIYNVLRISYYDKTGHWFFDYCGGYQSPLQNMQIEHPCSYIHENRHLAAQPQ